MSIVKTTGEFLIWWLIWFTVLAIITVVFGMAPALGVLVRGLGIGWIPILIVVSLYITYRSMRGDR